jgi:glycopeptide antibiotics resistance protein
MVDVNNLNTIRFVIGLSTILLFCSIWLGIVAFLRVRKKKSLVQLLLFTIFYIYLYKVLDYTLFQFQSLLLLKHFIPGLMLNGVTAGNTVNLIPLITLTSDDLRTSLLNILLMMPFGFGLPFLTNYSVKRILVMGALFTVAIELLQLLTGLTAKMTFRIADINDVVFNMVGVAIGYVLFVGFVRVYSRISPIRRLQRNTALS